MVVPDPLLRAPTGTVLPFPSPTATLNAVTITPAPCTVNLTSPLPPSLTTIFTPPASCFEDIYYLTPYSFELFPTQISGCYPSSTFTVFSPGVCPAGYTVVLAGLLDPGSCSSVLLTTTQYTCCPSSFTYNNITSSCLRSFNEPLVTNSGFIPITSTQTNYFTTKVIDVRPSSAGATLNISSFATSYRTQTATYFGLFAIQAPPFKVKFAASDSAVASTWASIWASVSQRSAAEASRASTSNVTSFSSTSATASGMPPPSPSSISGGAIAGIVIGVLTGLGILISMIFFLLRRRRRRWSAMHTKGTEDNDHWTKQELAGNPINHPELDGEQEKRELPGENLPPAELLGDTEHEPLELDLGDSPAMRIHDPD